MSNWSRKRIATGTVLTLVATQLAACGAAPTDASGESTGSASEAQCKNWPDCGPHHNPPPPPPPLTYHCSTAPYDVSTWGGWRDPNTNSSCYVSPPYCPTDEGDPILKPIEQRFVNLGCSNPVMWHPNRNNWSEADAVLMLCPNTAAVKSLSDSVGTLTASGSLEPSHENGGVSDPCLPWAPDGWLYVIPWECPTCPMGSCEDGSKIW